MMLEHFGEAEAAAAILVAIEDVLADGADSGVLTPDLGGSATTAALGAAIASRIAQA
jgi:tartrate dehydrogenase/decarboxylase/D-malate dehydrogenase